MPMQSFTVKQEHNGAQCQNGDRFIPHRCQFNRHGFYSTKILAESVEEEDILKQDISRVYVEEYGKHLQSALNLTHAHARLLSFCCTCAPEEKQPRDLCQWPVRCRKRPLIAQPHHLLDLPNFRAEFFLNPLDWGPSNYLAAAIHNTVYLYVPGDNPIELSSITNGYYSAVKWDYKEEKLILGTNGSLIEVWNTQNRKLIAHTKCNCTVSYDSDCIINALAWHTSNTTFVSGCSNGTLLLIPLSSFELQSEQTSILHAHEGQISSLRCSPDGRFLASSSEDGCVRLWLWPDLAPGVEFLMSEEPVRAIAWHPWKPSYLAIGGSISGTISLWNVNKHTEEAMYIVLDSSALVCSLEWSPITGELVASIWISEHEGGQEQMGRSVIVVLRTLSKVVDRMECYAGQIYHLLWSPDGKQIATVGSDETLRIWYFLGPSSAREKNICRLLKPLAPANFSLLPRSKRKNQNVSSCTPKISRQSLHLCMEEGRYSIHEYSFGCIIR